MEANLRPSPLEYNIIVPPKRSIPSKFILQVSGCGRNKNTIRNGSSKIWFTKSYKKPHKSESRWALCRYMITRSMARIIWWKISCRATFNTFWIRIMFWSWKLQECAIQLLRVAEVSGVRTGPLTIDLLLFRSIIRSSSRAAPGESFVNMNWSPRAKHWMGN